MAFKAAVYCFFIAVVISEEPNSRNDISQGDGQLIRKVRQPMREPITRKSLISKDSVMDRGTVDGAFVMGGRKDAAADIIRSELSFVPPTPTPTSTAVALTLPSCEWSEWSSWSKCDCRNGVHNRRRAALNFPSCASQFASEWEVGYCPKSSCFLREWMDRSTLTRDIVQTELSLTTTTHQPTQLDDALLTRICGWSEWSAWSVCNCVSGIQSRNRAPLNSNSNCVVSVACSREVELCRDDSCHIEPRMSEMRNASLPSTEAIRDSQKKPPFSIISTTRHPLSPSSVIMTAVTSPTPSTCIWSEWSPWTRCDCVKGVRHRQRKALDYPSCVSEFASTWEVGFCSKASCLLHNELTALQRSSVARTVAHTTVSSLSFSQVAKQSDDALNLTCGWSTWSAWSACDCRQRIQYRNRAPMSNSKCLAMVGCVREVEGCLNASCLLGAPSTMEISSTSSGGQSTITGASERPSILSLSNSSQDDDFEFVLPEETVSTKAIPAGSAKRTMEKKKKKGGNKKPTPDGIKRMITSTIDGIVDRSTETPSAAIYHFARIPTSASTVGTSSSEETGMTTSQEATTSFYIVPREDSEELTTASDQSTSRAVSSEEATTNESSTPGLGAGEKYGGSSASRHHESTEGKVITTSYLSFAGSINGTTTPSTPASDIVPLGTTATVRTMTIETTSGERRGSTGSEDASTKSGDVNGSPSSAIEKSSMTAFTSPESTTILITSVASSSPLIITASIGSTSGSPSSEKTTAQGIYFNTEASTTASLSATAAIPKPSATDTTGQTSSSTITQILVTSSSLQDTSSTIISTESTAASSTVPTTIKLTSLRMESTSTSVPLSTATITGTSPFTLGATEEEPITNGSTTTSTVGPRPTEEIATSEEPLTDEPDQTTTSTTAALICTWSRWSVWSPCDCRSGYRHRKRSPRIEGGCSINGCSRDVAPCREFPCKVDCVYSQWSCWSKCEGGCDGQGSRWRFRHIRLPGLYGGKKCYSSDMRDREYCMVNGCSINCDMGDWTAWTECRPDLPIASSCKCPSMVHGNREAIAVQGHRSRERTVTRRGNLPCPLSMEEEACTFQCCM